MSDIGKSYDLASKTDCSRVCVSYILKGIAVIIRGTIYKKSKIKEILKKKKGCDAD